MKIITFFYARTQTIKVAFAQIIYVSKVRDLIFNKSNTLNFVPIKDWILAHSPEQAYNNHDHRNGQLQPW